MTLAPLSRVALVWIVIFAMLLTNVSIATPTETAARSSTPTDIYVSTLVVVSVTSLGRWLTPLDEWETEIRKLTEDERFVERWMLLNDDPASLEKGKRAIAKIQKQRKAIEKKYNRFKWLYYPAITIAGAGALMLTFWFQKD